MNLTQNMTFLPMKLVTLYSDENQSENNSKIRKKPLLLLESDEEIQLTHLFSNLIRRVLRKKKGFSTLAQPELYGPLSCKAGYLSFHYLKQSRRFLG